MTSACFLHNLESESSFDSDNFFNSMTVEEFQIIKDETKCE
jgi:hypothetical protein